MSHVAIILTDASKKILWVNEDFTQITGYELHEVIGRKPGEMLQGPKSESHIINRMRSSLASGEIFKEEITNYRKNGEMYKCRLVVNPIFNAQNQLTNFIAFEIDSGETDDTLISSLQIKEKYHTSSLNKKEAIHLFKVFETRLTEEKLYLNPQFSLRMAAEMLQTNTKYLSQVVNHHSKANFLGFVNAFRIDAAKEKLIDPQFQHLTLYGIALQCGFKNKSTFYKVFKEMTHITPKEYIHRYKLSSFVNSD